MHRLYARFVSISRNSPIIFLMACMVASFGLGRYTTITTNIMLNTETPAQIQTEDEVRSTWNKPDAVKNKYGPPVRIALLGERNSGTTWITAELIKCFPTLQVTQGLTRDKHWFQTDDGTNPRNNTIVVAQFRNVYDWIEAMRKRPHHSPSHLMLEWKEFVEKPWTMPRPERDLDLPVKSGPICQEGYHYNQIISCIRPKNKPLSYGNAHNYSGWDPQYELHYNNSGLPYSSIIDLRADKIRNHLSIASWDWVSKLVAIRYERLLEEGTGWLLRDIEAAAGFKAECPDTPAAPERLTKYPHKKSYVKYMNERADWEAEELVGYKKTFV